MREAKSFAGLRKDYRAVTSVVAGDTAWSAEALLFVAEKIDNMKAAPPAHERRIGFLLGPFFVGIVW